MYVSPFYFMVSHRILLGSIAFGISFTLSLVTSRNFNQALGTGAIAVPSVWLATNIVHRHQRRHGESRLMLLAEQIRSLQQRRLDEYEAVLHLSTERQRLETHLYQSAAPLGFSIASSPPPPFLEGMVTPRAQLNPVLEPTQLMSIGAPPKSALSWDLSVAPISPVPGKSSVAASAIAAPVLPRSRSLPVASPHTLPTQMQEPPSRDADDLHKFLADKKSAKRKIEAKLNALQAEQAQVQVQLKEDRAALAELTQTLKAKQTALTQVSQQLPSLEQQKQTLSAEVATLQAELQSLTQQRAAVFQALTVAPPESVLSDPDFPAEWQALKAQLLEHEWQVLRAIAEQPNPAPAIKKLAEANLTMPELLIDTVNERALDTIGDLILDSTPNTVNVVPEHLSQIQRLLASHET